jgi:hypothetical protein
MPRFEVSVPSVPASSPEDVTLRVDAEHWLAALKAGLERLGDRQPATHVLCDVQPDGSLPSRTPERPAVPDSNWAAPRRQPPLRRR